MAWSLQNLGYLAQHEGDHRQAAALFAECLALFVEAGNKVGAAECLESLASLALAERPAGAETQPPARGGAGRVPRLLGAAEALREAANTPVPPYRRAAYERDVAAARQMLDERAFAAAWAEGRALSLEQAAAYALEGEALG